ISAERAGAPMNHPLLREVRPGRTVIKGRPMDTRHNLKPATEMVKQNHVRFPDESDEYRRARDRLLIEEIELRRHIERVAAQRRALPPGGKVPKDYEFVGENGAMTFSQLFGNKQTLAIYSF